MTTGHDPERRRRSIRLQDYDYTLSGAYFVTIVVQNRLCLFGAVEGDDMRLNEAGNMARAVWNSLAARFPDLDLDAFVVMPNHIHGIIVLTGAATSPAGAQPIGRPTTRVAPTSARFPASTRAVNM